MSTQPTDDQAWQVLLEIPEQENEQAVVGAFARAVLAKWGTPQPVVREPIGNKELASLAKVGAIATNESGKVVVWPALYRTQMLGRFERGWREAEKYHGITGGQT